MDEVHVMDATGLVALESALAQLQQRRCVGILSGVHDQPLSLLKKAGFDRKEGVILSATAAEALVLASRSAGVTAASQ
jgi:anti-anti-sigma regulatory factor